MCITIVRTHEEVEFAPNEPLEYQIKGAKQVVINYDPTDSSIEQFMEQMDRIVKNGVSCQMNIKVNNNNFLNGYKFERKVEEANRNIEVNEVIKTLISNHYETDKKLCEISQMCTEKNK